MTSTQMKENGSKTFQVRTPCILWQDESLNVIIKTRIFQLRLLEHAESPSLYLHEQACLFARR